MQIYEPAEDSILLAQCVEKISLGVIKRNPHAAALDMGSGSGIQAEALVKSGLIKDNILTSDISKEAVDNLRKKGFKSVNSDLFSKVKGKFDIIIFNPPYLPYNKYDSSKDTCGGKKGYETALKFLRQLKSHLSKKGVVLLLISSLANPDIIKKEIMRQNLKCRKIASEKFFFEEIFVFSIKR